jgi:ABC-2 type transport system permease protein
VTSVGRTARTTRELAKRSLVHAFRRPPFLAPVIVLPTVVLAAYSGNVSSAVRIPGFPHVHGFLDYILAGAMVLAAGLAAVSGGIALATDIEMKVMDRFLATPAPRSAILFGRLAGTTTWGTIGAVWFLAIGLLFGAKLEGGVPGALTIVALVSLTTLAISTLVAGLALRAGRASVIDGLFPLVIVLMMISSAFFPRELLLEPVQTIAAANPISYIANAIREPWISSAFSLGTVAEGCLAILVVAGIGTLICASAFRHRTATT